MTIKVDWDKYAKQYDSVTISGANPAYLELREKVKNIFSKTKIKKGSLIVDLGGGTGNFSLPLAESYPESKFVIVDLSTIMLKMAEKKAKEKRLKNVDVINGDIEDIDSIVNKYSRPITHVLMMHCLYATRSQDDPDKPQRILNNIFKGLDNSESIFVISDINRPLRTGNWIPYCLWHTYKVLGSIKATIQFFKENDQSKLANRYIDLKQNEGDYLICELNELVKMIEAAGFSRIIEQADYYYRGRDNFVVAGK